MEQQREAHRHSVMRYVQIFAGSLIGALALIIVTRGYILGTWYGTGRTLAEPRCGTGWIS
jgi:hypothetical protein